MTQTLSSPAPQARAVDPDRLNAFLGQVIGDLGATISAALVVIGDRLGLYRGLRGGVPVSTEELAERTGTAAAYVAPWLANQAAGGYVLYDPGSGTWTMTRIRSMRSTASTGRRSPPVSAERTKSPGWKWRLVTTPV